MMLQEDLSPVVRARAEAMSEPSSPFVSVIVPVYNDAARLRECLAALEAQTYPSDRYEVIVVDNGSSEPVAPALDEYCHAVAEFEAQAGSYAARNRGLAVARGEVLAFTDADCLPTPTWLEEGVRALEDNPGCGLVAGAIRVVPLDPRAPTAVERFELTFAFSQADYVREGYGATANLFARRDVFERVGPFRAELKSCGDREWGMRVRAAGYELVYAEDAVVGHPARRTWGEMQRKAARICGGMFQLSRMQGVSRGAELRQVAGLLKPPLRVALRLFREDTPPGVRAKLEVLAVLVFRRWVTAFEWLRLSAGSRSSR